MTGIIISKHDSCRLQISSGRLCGHRRWQRNFHDHSTFCLSL